MDKLDSYRNAVKQVLTGHADIFMDVGEVEAQLIFDETHDHYQLNYVGWRGYERVFGPVLHLDIKNGKVWLQYNGTEDAIAQRLVERGVPSSDIVLGFHSEFKRQFTQYAVS